jgi:hypothetical protein
MTTDDDSQTLKNIERYLEVLVRMNYSRILRESFAEDSEEPSIEERVFELIGVKKRDDICKELHIGPNKLSELCNRWYALGLLVKEGGGFRKTVE